MSVNGSIDYCDIYEYKGEDISGWFVEDVNGDGFSWNTSPFLGFNSSGGMYYNYNFDGITPAEDWLFSQCFVLDSSLTYDLSFYYRVAASMFPENLSVYIGHAQSSLSMSTNLILLDSITIKQDKVCTHR